VVYTFNLDNSTYAPGAPITATAAASPALCNNGDQLGVNQEMAATINGQTQSLYNNFVSQGNSAINQSTFTAQTTPGSYDALFVASSSYFDVYDQVYDYSSVPVTDQIPYGVAAGGSSSISTSSVASSSTPSPAGPPDCTFNSNPSTILVPESSNLDYACENVTSCEIQGGDFGYSPGQPLSINPDFTTQGSQSVSITTSTVYTLNCRGGGSNSNYIVNLQANVNVGSTNLFEIAP
jgi:hypothetical protein